MESKANNQFLESHFSSQYSKAMGWVVGYNWMSVGGEYATRDLLTNLHLTAGDRVLDVGCGTGGSAFYMARYYGVYVHGVDCIPTMIQEALDQLHKLEEEVKKMVTFEICDIETVELEAESYDVVFSRDSLLYMKEKAKLYHEFNRVLKPGGTLLFSEYCNGFAPLYTPEYMDYSTNIRRFRLHTVKSIDNLLWAADYEDVKTEDLNQEFLQLHQRELKALISKREAFIAKFSQDIFHYFVNHWTIKEDQGQTPNELDLGTREDLLMQEVTCCLLSSGQLLKTK